MEQICLKDFNTFLMTWRTRWMGQSAQSFYLKWTELSLTPGPLVICAITMVFVVRVHKNTRYLLKFAGSRAKRAVQDIVLGGLSAQGSTCLSEHSTLLQQTVPLWDRKTQRVPELLRTQQMEEQRAHDWMREKGEKRFRIWRVTITQQLCLLNC